MLNIYDLDTPALLVDLDVLEDNISRMAEAARLGNKSLRPHAKTHKIPEIGHMQLHAGAVGLTVAKLSEAEVFVNHGCSDLFIANQIVGAAKIARLLDLHERSKLQVAVDSIDVALPMGTAAHARSTQIKVRIEVDTGLGRAGTRSMEETIRLADMIASHPGLDFEGIFTHEGHLYRLFDPMARLQAAKHVASELASLAECLKEKGTPAKTISVGSTPGAAIMLTERAPTEVRPGVYVFNDRMQVGLGTDLKQCAVTVLATVTSIRSDGRVIIDAGTKSLASDKPFADQSCGEIMGRPELYFVGASEEHGHLQVDPMSEVQIRIGDKVRVVPNHVCTCVNMHDKIYGYRREYVEETWMVAGRGKIQ